MNELNELQEAYLRWFNTFPGNTAGASVHIHSTAKTPFRIPLNWDGDCSCRSHYRYTQLETRNRDGYKHFITREEPQSDQKVCPRERAWRDYISIRDGIDYHVLDNPSSPAPETPGTRRVGLP